MPANPPTPPNALYYGDNLYILRKYIKDETIDLVYIDPPFNSKVDYNTFFKERDGTRAAGQIKAFEDTWHWDVRADRTYRELLRRADPIAQAMYAFYRLLGTSDVFAYLTMMAARLVELHRILKPTGSFYLHCDPAASHYLKVLLDAIFGPGHCRNEIIWKRTGAHSSAKRYGPVHDVILFYTKGETFTWNPQHQPYAPEYVRAHYTQVDGSGRRYMADNLTAAGKRNGSSGQPWRGFAPGEKGNHWKFAIETLERLDAEERIHWPANGGWPRYKRFLDTMKGLALQDIWTDIAPVNAKAIERIGYPTQKPIALLDRIIRSSSNEGDVVLDAFCGCGTAVAAAQERKRPWVGIDITHTAIEVIRDRLNKEFGEGTAPEPIGQPQTIEDAKQLAKDSPYAFEDWALELVGADQPAKKKGADKGVDGRRVIGFSMDGKPLEMLVSVKSGRASSPHVRDLRGTVEREGAAIGLFLTLQEPTKAMRDETLVAGPCELPGYIVDCPRMQILTIAELLDGEQPQLPALLPVASPPPKPRPTEAAPVTPFQRPLPGAAVVDVSKPPTARPDRLRAVGGSRKQSAGD